MKQKVTVVFTIFLLMYTVSALSVFAQKNEVSVEKSVEPSDIMLAGTGSPDTTTVTISVTGYGGTVEDTLPLDVVFAIDSSGSMSWNDPDDLRLDAAKTFTDKLNDTRDQAGVVSWDYYIDFTYGLSSNLTEVKNQIDLVNAIGGTNLDTGLNASIAMLDANTRVEESVEVIVFLSNGQGSYTWSGETGSYTDDAASKGYVIYTIGLGNDTWVDALTDIANTTGGSFYEAPTADTLDDIFDEIFTTIITHTAPYDVDVVEVTESYIVDEGSFSIAPDSVVEVGGKTHITWYNVAQYVGDYNDRLAADETFEVSFDARSSQSGQMLPVDSKGDAVVYYMDPDDEPKMVLIPQAYINVNSPPDCNDAYASLDVLWPPNHKMVEITIEGVTDPDGDDITITVTGIWQDEPTNGLGDGDKSPDGDGVGTSSAWVRRERSGLENGRVYHIYFTAEDEYGAICECEVTVSVPHDMRGAPAVDGGAIYDSTV